MHPTIASFRTSLKIISPTKAMEQEKQIHLIGPNDPFETTNLGAKVPGPSQYRAVDSNATTKTDQRAHTHTPTYAHTVMLASTRRKV